MSDIIKNNILTSTYLITWILTLIWYQRKNSKIDGGTAAIFFYIVYAVFSILTINDPLFSSMFNPLEVFPYIYLYSMLMLALAPVIYNHIHPTKIITPPNSRILTLLAIFIIVNAVVLIPSILSDGVSGMFKLFSDETAGKEAYSEMLSHADETGKAISNVPSIFFNATSLITIFLLFYFLTTNKKNKWLICGLAFCVCLNVFIPVTHGMRGGTIEALLVIIGAYALFSAYMDKRIVKRIRNMGIIFFCAISLPILAITVSRFGESAGGAGGAVNWYVGQGSLYFNNYALNAGGTRNGERVLNYFKRLTNNDVPHNYVERRDKYHNLELDDNYFSTFVGDFCIDFGPVCAVFIFVFFAIVATRAIRTQRKEIKLHQILLLYFTLCVSLQGGMTLFTFSDAGNLQLIVFATLYIYLRYHEKLLEVFPLKE